MKETFENPFCRVELSFGDDCKVTAAVTVTTLKVESLYKQAIKIVSKHISLPGFRKGKAPEAVILGRYTPQIEAEWKELIVREGVNASFEASKIYPYHDKLLEGPRLLSCKRGEEAHLTFAYERYPQIPEVDFTQIRLSPIEVEAVSDAQREEVEKSVCQAHATYETLEEKEIEEGDYAEISINHGETGNPMLQNRRVHVEKTSLIDWLYELLLGMKAEETKVGSMLSDETEPVPVQISVHTVQRCVLPAREDALAQKMGSPSWEDVRAKILHNLEQDAQAVQREKQQLQLEEVLLATYPFDIPASLRLREGEAISKKRLEHIEHTEGAAAAAAQRMEIEKEALEQADKKLHLFFLGRQIAKQGKLTLSKEEIAQELSRRFRYSSPEEVRSAASEEVFAEVSAMLLDRKVKEYALSAVLTN